MFFLCTLTVLSLLVDNVFCGYGLIRSTWSKNLLGVRHLMMSSRRPIEAAATLSLVGAFNIL